VEKGSSEKMHCRHADKTTLTVTTEWSVQIACMRLTDGPQRVRRRGGWISVGVRGGEEMRDERWAEKGEGT
jgi:hypothetical protein